MCIVKVWSCRPLPSLRCPPYWVCVLHALARTFPPHATTQIKGNDQENRVEIYTKTLEVLGPEVEKAKQFLRFMQRAAASFTEEVKTLSHPGRIKDFISEYYLLTLARLINMFSTLDSLKNMKACINNDLACYRR